MTDELPRRRHPLWFMVTLAVVACGAAGAFRYWNAPQTAARAIVQVPSATDIGTLCQQPEITTAAVAQLESEGDLYLTLEQPPGGSRLSGKLTAAKLKSATQAPGTASAETWELTYRTPHPERALVELNTLVDVLAKRVTPPATSDSAAEQQLAQQVANLEAKHQTLQTELNELAADVPADRPDAATLTASRDRVQSLQRALTDAQVLRLQAEDDCRLVEQEVRNQQHLDAIATRLTAGPVQEAVLEIERQRKLSAELTRLNETERRLGMVYGDKHPKLIELRQKFDSLLDELGGWDHILDEAHVAERVQMALAQLLDLKQQHESNLQTQIELVQESVTANDQSVEQRTVLTADLQQTALDLAAARQAQQAAVAARASHWSVPQPAELIPPNWTASLAALMAAAAASGLMLGWLLNRVTFPAANYYHESPPPAPELPVIPPPPETQLDLAQRRALRQARLQQVYAA